MRGKGRPAHEPDDKTRKMVSRMAGLGMKYQHIGLVVGIDTKTLMKYYNDDLQMGQAAAHEQIAAALFNKAINGDITAMIFWAKTRMGFREVKQIDATIGNPDGSNIKQIKLAPLVIDNDNPDTA